MAKLDYPIYDTAVFGTTANNKTTLFQSGQGSGGGNGEAITNMRGSGQFPDRETFEIMKIGIHINTISLTDDDIQGLFVNSILTLNYNNVKMLQAPLYMFSDLNAVQGIKTESTASPFDMFGQEGKGYDLRKPLVIQGGKSFNVEILQGLAVDNASQNLYCVLYGMLDAPDING